MGSCSGQSGVLPVLLVAVVVKLGGFMTFFTSRGAGSVRSCELIPSTFLDFWARFLIAAAGEQSETGEHDACQLVRISMCTLWMCRWLITRPQVDV